MISALEDTKKPGRWKTGSSGKDGVNYVSKQTAWKREDGAKHPYCWTSSGG